MGLMLVTKKFALKILLPASHPYGMMIDSMIIYKNFICIKAKCVYSIPGSPLKACGDDSFIYALSQADGFDVGDQSQELLTINYQLSIINYPYLYISSSTYYITQNKNR